MGRTLIAAGRILCRAVPCLDRRRDELCLAPSSQAWCEMWAPWYWYDAVMGIDVSRKQAVDDKEVGFKKIALQACCASCDNGYDAMTGVGSDLTNNG